MARHRELVTNLVASKSSAWLSAAASRWVGWELFALVYGIDTRQATAEHILAFAHARLLGGAKPKTVRGDLAYLKAVYGEEVNGAHRFVNHLARSGFASPERQAPTLTVGQIWGMVLAPADVPASALGRTSGRFPIDVARARLRAGVIVAYVLAMRPAEAATIEMESLDLSADGQITLTFEEVKQSGSDSNRRVTRLIPADHPLADLLHRSLTTIFLERDTFTGTLFETNAKGVGRLLTVAAAAAGVTSFSPYSLRRSSATHNALRGAPVDELRALLRHAPGSPSTLRYVESVHELWTKQTDLLAAEPVISPPVHPREVDGGTRTGGEGQRLLALDASWPVLVPDEAQQFLGPQWPHNWCERVIQDARNASRRYDLWLGMTKCGDAESETTVTAYAVALLEGSVPTLCKSQLARPAGPKRVLTQLRFLEIAHRLLHGQEIQTQMARTMAEGAQHLHGKPSQRRGRVLTDDEIDLLVGEAPAPPSPLPPLCQIIPRPRSDKNFWTELPQVWGQRPNIERSLSNELIGNDRLRVRVTSLLVRVAQERLFAAVLYASGARGGDLYRAHVDAVERYNHGLLIIFNSEAVKNRRTGTSSSGRFWCWAPANGRASCPVAAYDTWVRVWSWFTTDPLVAGTQAGRVWVKANSTRLFPRVRSGIGSDKLLDDPQTLMRPLVQRPKLLGLLDVRTASGRVTVIDGLVRQGVDLFAVAQRMQHVRPEVTQGYSPSRASFRSQLEGLA